MSTPVVSDRQLRLVIVASTLGTIIEWYDFYIFGSLATILSAHFFPKDNPVAAFLETVAIFTIGFLIRPLGAFVFGRIGDLIGRKYTFLVTLTGMGLSTALIGVVPSYAQIGIAAPIILFLLRIIQGLTLGGEYGGAITYVAEHAPDERRGYWTGWLQTSPSAGLLVSLAVVIGTRLGLGDEAFTAWGWRIPFLVSFILVAIS
ncbi:MAG TPA: MFS transporter, partial [Thermaerobacter sp.]